MMKKYGVFDPLTGVYVFVDNQEQIAPKLLEVALALYYMQCNGGHFFIANVDENGHETSGENVTGMTEIPQEILDAAINNINENL